MRLAFALSVVALLTGPVWARACPNPQGWASPQQLLAARAPEMKAGLKPGGTVQIGLFAEGQVRFASGKATRTGYAGVTAIDVPKAGTLELVLDNKTYLDLVRHGKVLDLAGEPRAHGCPGIQKALDFKVEPGRYVVELSGSPTRTVKLASSLR